MFYPRSAVTWFSQCSGKFRPRGILLQTGVETDWQSTAIDANREITLSFRFVSTFLRLTVAPLRPFRAVEPATASAGPSIDLEAPSSESLVVDQFGISVALEEQVLVAEGPVPLAALPFDFLQSYILGAFPELRAGIAASRRLQGITCGASGPSIPFRNITYIILRSPSTAVSCGTSGEVDHSSLTLPLCVIVFLHRLRATCI